MNTTIDSPIEEIIKTRISVRSYTAQSLTQEIKKKIIEYTETLSNPFDSKVTFRMLESDAAKNSAKLGTYGVIKGAKDYIGAAVHDEDFALEGLGYEFEKLILYITSLGVGTCWLGGTFNRSAFAKAMAIKADELFPAISPIGFAAEKRSITDSLVRFMAKGDTRKPWMALFFNQNLATPLSASDAGRFESSLEMVRLAPSASNKQPWRVVKDKKAFHFYECKSPGYSKPFGYDIQRIDMGIAACHFHLTAIEKGLKGEFKKLSDPISDHSEDTVYVFSWVSEQDENQEE